MKCGYLHNPEVVERNLLFAFVLLGSIGTVMNLGITFHGLWADCAVQFQSAVSAALRNT